VRVYRDVHFCDDMQAIQNLRNRYSVDQLKNILELLKNEEKQNNLNIFLTKEGRAIFPY
jgi:hypothetical protein